MSQLTLRELFISEGFLVNNCVFDSTLYNMYGYNTEDCSIEQCGGLGNSLMYKHIPVCSFRYVSNCSDILDVIVDLDSFWVDPIGSPLPRLSNNIIAYQLYDDFTTSTEHVYED
jgi:hypothetical protein